MCELFGISSLENVKVNSLLKEFFSHGARHPHGWGLAVFYENSVSLEKEPVRADKSLYLKERLHHPLKVKNAIAHIRLATMGNMEYENSHPFVKRDNFGRSWTLAHNGTIFDAPVLNPYVNVQEGRTDSERILCYIIRRVNEQQRKEGRPLQGDERFRLLDQIICELAPGNKLNLLIYDGEYLYVHTNYERSLYVCHQTDHTAVFSTVPLTSGDWQLVPFTTLCAWKEGNCERTGTCHNQKYVDNPEDMKYIYTSYSEL